MKKRIIVMVLAGIMVLGSGSVVFASENYIEDNKFLGTRIESDENREELQSLDGGIVYLTLWVSHRNYHTSYTKTVIRQGKKYTVTYIAAPRENCKYCKIKSY